MSVDEVARRVSGIAGLLRRSAAMIIVVNVVGALLLAAGLWRFGWPRFGTFLGFLTLVPTLGLWQFRNALVPVVELPAELAARSGSTEDLTATVSNVAGVITKADRSVLGFARLARQLKTEVDALADTDFGAAFEGLKAVQPARLSAAAGATGLAFTSLVFGALMFVAALLFG